MRSLFQSVLALCTLGLAMLGCNRSSPSGPSGEGDEQGKINTPYQAAFRVPGMT
jgi:hypothetical protein